MSMEETAPQMTAPQAPTSAAPQSSDGIQTPLSQSLPQAQAQATPAPQPQPAPAPQPDQKQPFWKSLLQGALRGLGGSVGAKNFGEGLGRGANGEIEGEQRDITNKLNADANTRANAESASGIRFQDYQSAKAAADINHTGLVIAGMKEDQREAKEKFGMSQVEFNQKNFGTSYKQVPFTQDNARLYLQQASNGTAGAHVPDGVIVTPTMMYIPVSDSENSVASDYAKYKSQGDALGLTPVSRQAYMAMNPAQRRATAQISNDIFSGNAQAGQLNSRINILQNAVNRASSDPNADPGMVQHMKDVLAQYNSLKGMNNADDVRKNDLKTESGVAVANARNNSKVMPVTNPDGSSGFSRAGSLVDGGGSGGGSGTGTPGTPKPKPVPNNNGAMYLGTTADGHQVAGSQQELQAAGVQSMSKLANDETSKIHTSRQLIAPDGLFHAVAKDISVLESQGKLGPVSSRWSDFVSGKVGSGPEFASLRANINLLATALMQAHMGAKGGQESVEHFKHLADYRISDAATLRSALSSEFKYVTEKAAFIPKGKK